MQSNRGKPALFSLDFPNPAHSFAKTASSDPSIDYHPSSFQQSSNTIGPVPPVLTHTYRRCSFECATGGGPSRLRPPPCGPILSSPRRTPIASPRVPHAFVWSVQDRAPYPSPGTIVVGIRTTSYVTSFPPYSVAWRISPSSPAGSEVETLFSSFWGRYHSLSSNRSVVV